MTRHVCFSSALLCLLVATRPIAAAEHELLLTTGEVTRGVIVEQTDTVVVLERIIQGKSKAITARVTYLRSKIAKISEVAVAPDPLADYRRKCQAAGPSAEEQWELAKWCEGQGMPKEAIHHYGLTLKAKPGNDDALTKLAELGALEVDGVWMHPEDLAEREGIATEEDTSKDRSRTIAIVKSNQAEKQLAEARKEHERLRGRLIALPIEIQQTSSDEAAAKFDASSAETNALLAKNRADDLWRQINDYNRDGNDTMARSLRGDHSQALADVTRYQKDGKAALAAQAQAAKTRATLQKELVEANVRMPNLEVDLKTFEAAAAQARSERDAVNAAKGK